VIDNHGLVYHIIKSQELIPWEQVVKQILESDFNIAGIDLPNGENKFDALTQIKNPQKMELLRPSSSLNRDELSNVIKCLLIISPDKSERRSNGEPLASKGHKAFNRNLLDKYQNSPEVTGLLPKVFTDILNNSYWYWQEYSGKAGVQLSDYFVSDVLKDPRAIATWYSIKMPH
jgi:hypothetical protein